MLRRSTVFSVSALVLILLIGGILSTKIDVFAKAQKQMATGTAMALTESSAIQQVLKEHPDFPSKAGETKIVRLPTGGPAGTTSMVELKTTAEKISDGKYQITLTKDWQLVVNGQKVFSYWKYNVGPDGVTLLESDERDSLPNQMK